MDFVYIQFIAHFLLHLTLHICIRKKFIRAVQVVVVNTANHPLVTLNFTVQKFIHSQFLSNLLEIADSMISMEFCLLIFCFMAVLRRSKIPRTYTTCDMIKL